MQKEDSAATWIALLGRRDTPTDGLEDYCIFLGRALAAKGIELKLARVEWNRNGWLGALRQLARESKEWSGKWAILQYTALAWSGRGFPLGAVVALWILRRNGVRCAVMFHEPCRQGGGSGLINWVRQHFQDWAIRKLYGRAHVAIFADPLATISWLPKSDTKAAFISIGGNIPEPADVPIVPGAAVKTVAVFCVDDPPNREPEINDIAYAMQIASSTGKKLRLTFLGRGTEDARQEINRAFHTMPVEVVNVGLQSASEVSRVLAGADAMLCVRGKLFPRRGSALAGIACGLPIIGYAGAAEKTHLMEAGLELVPYQDRDALGAALARVLSDDTLRAALREKSARAQEKYFRWSEIAGRYTQALAVAAAKPKSPSSASPQFEK